MKTKSFVEVTVRLVLEHDTDNEVDIDKAMENIAYEFHSEDVKVMATEIIEWNIE